MSIIATVPRPHCRFVLLGVIAIAALAVLEPRHVAASTPPAPAAGDLLDETAPDQTSGYIRDLIERAQRALGVLGLYGGPPSGTVDAQLIEALKRFQSRSGLPDTTIIDEDLVGRLEASVNVEQLLERLDAARTREAQKAREALLSNPETRHLLDGADVDETADPTRDASGCFDDPSPRCLLDEAVESAKAIASDGRRDWAYGEILVAQVHAGLTEDALATVRRITDPRLIIVALRRIAEAEAAAGRAEAALDAVNVIPDRAERLAAASAVAQLLSGLSLHDAAFAAADRLMDDQNTADLELTRHLAEVAPVLATGGRRDRANRLLVEIALETRNADNGSGRDARYRHIANAYLAIGEPEIALQMLDQVGNVSDRNAILIAAAAQLAATGQQDDARALAAQIAGERYRAVALAGIAEQQHYRGDGDDARDTLQAAEKVLNEIDLPYARDYAASRIALVYAADPANGTETARPVATAIRDPRLRAETLWRMVLLGRPELETAAEEATSSIFGKFDRAWLFNDLAERQISAADLANGAALFERALALARDIATPWARARILARLSISLTELENPRTP